MLLLLQHLCQLLPLLQPRLLPNLVMRQQSQLLLPLLLRRSLCLPLSVAVHVVRRARNSQRLLMQSQLLLLLRRLLRLLPLPHPLLLLLPSQRAGLLL